MEGAYENGSMGTKGQSVENAGRKRKIIGKWKANFIIYGTRGGGIKSAFGVKYCRIRRGRKYRLRMEEAI
jgi:hypothetical protein